MIKAVIFDCFGVLVTDALSATVESLRLKDHSKAERVTGLINAAARGMDPAAFRTAVAAELGLTLDEYLDVIQGGEARNQSLLDYIKELRGTYKTALLSNINQAGLDARFPNNELAQYFNVVIASSSIGFAKPEAQAYEITADKLGVRYEECVMIDDRDDYCQGAVSVGMRAIQYVSFEQTKRELEQIIKEG